MNGNRDNIDVCFEKFYAANFPRVKNFARLLTKSEEDAEDIAPCTSQTPVPRREIAVSTAGYYSFYVRKLLFHWRETVVSSR